jgi:uncharacterized circularly permuted ATP-grasp superfamily protein
LMQTEGHPRAEAALLIRKLESFSPEELRRRQHTAERVLLQMGITFNVYGDSAGTERIFPFDIVPRIVSAIEWQRIERGLKQRVHALNQFIDDVYHDQHILKDKIVPEELIRSAQSFRQPCVGLHPPRGIWCHITGTDLVRDRDGQMHVQPVDDYPSRLLDMLQYVAPLQGVTPNVVVLTPGIFNSAYFEHSFLARQMGVELVEGRDLVVADGLVCMRTTRGLQRVDVIYRRVDDDALDPLTFRPDSLLGVPGLMNVYRAGRVALVNAPGNGIADDKVLYAYVPKIVRYYEGEDIILPNVPTYICADDEDRTFVLEHLDQLVVKAANESGGYGMLVGPHSTAAERDEFGKRIAANPRNYIAQPTLALSRAPVLVEDHFEGRHVDLRPYVLYGKDIYVLPGGLTRVALKKGSLVVNSSQGGGSKDTWVASPQVASNGTCRPAMPVQPAAATATRC